MIRTKQLFMIFIPAIFIAGMVFSIRVLQYKPLYPNDTYSAPSSTIATIPILSGDPILGSKKAPKTIIVFEDFGCPACADQMRTLQALMEKHPNKLRVIWKGLSITRIPYSSETAHTYGFCLNEQQQFAPFAEQIFAQSDSLSDDTIQTALGSLPIDQNTLSACLSSARPGTYLETTKAIAEALGIQSLPAVFVDNKQVTPPQFLEGWETLLGV